MNESEVEFGKILRMFKLKDNIFFYFKIFKEITFNENFQGFIVNQNSN